MRLPPLVTSFCVLVLGLGIGCSTSDSGEAPTVVASESPTAKELSVETILARAQRATGSLQERSYLADDGAEAGGHRDSDGDRNDVERPDQAYAVFETEALGNFEMVIDRLELFVRFPGEEWQTAERRLGSSPGEMGFAPPISLLSTMCSRLPRVSNFSTMSSRRGAHVSRSERSSTRRLLLGDR